MTQLSQTQKEFLQQSHLLFINNQFPNHIIIHTQYSQHTNNYYSDIIIPNQPNSSNIIQSELTPQTENTPLIVEHYSHI